MEPGSSLEGGLTLLQRLLKQHGLNNPPFGEEDGNLAL